MIYLIEHFEFSRIHKRNECYECKSLLFFYLDESSLDFPRKKLPNRLKGLFLGDGEDKFDFSSGFVGVRGSGTGSGFFIVLPHLSHFAAEKLNFKWNSVTKSWIQKKRNWNIIIIKNIITINYENLRFMNLVFKFWKAYNQTLCKWYFTSCFNWNGCVPQTISTKWWLVPRSNPLVPYLLDFLLSQSHFYNQILPMQSSCHQKFVTKCLHFSLGHIDSVARTSINAI